MNEDAALLQDYSQSRSPEAFRRLVDRYIDVVHSAARRQLGGDAAAAEDVTQAVFIILAEKAPTLRLRAAMPLSAWLLRVTRYASADVRRRTARRALHERRAGEMARQNQNDHDRESTWAELAPLLDEGLATLRSKDRDVLVLRYFDRKDNRQVAATLGISVDAAEKRASRAVERLRSFFRRRGVAVSAVALTGGLITHSAEAAPAVLSASVASAASSTVGSASAATAIAKGTVIAMTAAKTKAAVVAVVVTLLVVGGGGAVVIRTMQTPSSRQVRVKDQPAAASQLVLSTAQRATLSLGPALPWSVTFSDGTRVELVGVTATPGKPTGWWAGDGSPIAAPRPLPRVSGRFDAPGNSIYQFVLREYLGSPDSSIDVDLAIPTAGGSSANTISPIGGRRLELMAAIPSDTTSVDLKLNCSSGPWQAEWRYDLKPSSGRPASATQPAGVVIGKVYEQGGKTQVEITDNRPFMSPSEWQNQLISVDGEAVGATSMTTRLGGPTVCEFNLPLKKAVAVTKRSRAIQTQDIRNVSLRLRTSNQLGIVLRPTTAP